jgi:hypothetical protein
VWPPLDILFHLCRAKCRGKLSIQESRRKDRPGMCIKYSVVD